MLKISVVAHPNSKKPRVEEDEMKVLHVYVSSPPHEGKANTAVIESLAEFYKTKKGNVTLLRGGKSKQKVFEIG